MEYNEAIVANGDGRSRWRCDLSVKIAEACSVAAFCYFFAANPVCRNRSANSVFGRRKALFCCLQSSWSLVSLHVHQRLASFLWYLTILYNVEDMISQKHAVKMTTSSSPLLWCSLCTTTQEGGTCGTSQRIVSEERQSALSLWAWVETHEHSLHTLSSLPTSSIHMIFTLDFLDTFIVLRWCMPQSMGISHCGSHLPTVPFVRFQVSVHGPTRRVAVLYAGKQLLNISMYATQGVGRHCHSL